MKRLLFFLLLVFVASCTQDRIPKPEPFMSEEQLIAFHVDLALVNASTGISKEHYVPLDSLYTFHGIDSLIFVQNNTYYASKLKQYIRIFEAVEVRIEALEKTDTTSNPSLKVKVE